MNQVLVNGPAKLQALPDFVVPSNVYQQYATQAAYAQQTQAAYIHQQQYYGAQAAYPYVQAQAPIGSQAIGQAQPGQQAQQQSQPQQQVT